MTRAGGVRGAALALLVLTGFASAEEPARLRVDPHARSAASLDHLPPILGTPELRDTLTSGLTTTLALRLRSPRTLLAAASVEIRWEPWDEVFLVTLTDGDGRRRETLDDPSQLVAWWASLRVVIPEAGPSSRLTEATTLEVTVLPFSAAEAADTERWFSESLEGAGRTRTEKIGQSTEENPSVVSRTLGLLLATSLERPEISHSEHRLQVEVASP